MIKIKCIEEKTQILYALIRIQYASFFLVLKYYVDSPL